MTAFISADHDRAGHLRTEPVAAEVWITVGNGRVRIVDGALHRASGPADGLPVFLGTVDGQSVAASVVARIEPAEEAIDLRAAFGILGAEDLGLAAHAVGMARWIETTRFCTRCGSALTLSGAGYLATCGGCGAEHHPRTDPAVIMGVTDVDDRILLAHNTAWPQGMYSVLAGFVEPGESLEGAVAREVAEEVGVRAYDVTYVASQPWPFPSSIMLGFMARTDDVDLTVDGTEIADARWFTRTELAEALRSGELWVPPQGISISSHLVERWYGGPLSGPPTV